MCTFTSKFDMLESQLITSSDFIKKESIFPADLDLFRMTPSTKIAQMVPLLRTKEPPEL